MTGTHEGFLLVADLTGYTLYLSQSELDHAQQILTVLLELLVDHTRPPLVLSRLAGDAVISYGLQDHFYGGQTFIEKIETTYVDFRKAIEGMVLNNTCRCAACANISSLDLKFFVHYGTFAIQRIGDHDELVGSDVNLLHRLLKNKVTEKTGFKAYTLYTHAAIDHLGIQEICETLSPHTEAYEHLGEVQVWIQDMHPVWAQKREAVRVTLPPERVSMQFETEIGLPPELVWDYLNQPAFRKTLFGSDRFEVIHRSHGRIAPGSVYQCYHGDKFIPETILEWQPFERMITQDVVTTPVANTTVLVELHLAPSERGTRLIQSISKSSGPLLGRILTDTVLSRLGKRGQDNMEAFRQHVETDFAARTPEVAAGDAVSLPEHR